MSREVAVATPFVELSDAVAVVTAAGSGIGQAVTHALARRGSRVVVTDIRTERAETVAAEIQAAGGTAFAVRCDVSSLADIEHVRDTCLAAFGRVDVVMNNVGVPAVEPPELSRSRNGNESTSTSWALSAATPCSCRWWVQR